MGTPTPRKFSEKIALMERKQNEDQELFHSIMRDVKAITSNNSLSNPTTPLPCTQSSNQPSNNFLFYQNNNQGQSSNTINNIYQQPLTTTDTPYQEIPITSNTLQLQNNSWNGVGGSLPNVHDPYFNQNQTIPQNTLNAFYINSNNNLNHNPTQTGSSYSSSHLRSRSPGAPNHYHPYSGGGTLSIIRSRPHYEKQNTFDGYEINYPGTSNQLVPPDMYPHKARSDSAINIHPHTNYHNKVIYNNNHCLNNYYNQSGNVQNYEQLHNICNQNGMINNGNLIDDTCNPNNTPSYNNYLPSSNSSRQQSPIPQQKQTTQPPTNFCINFPYDNPSNSPIHSPQYPPTSTYSGVSSPVCYTPSLGSPNSISQDSPINNIYPTSTNNIQQQSTTEYPCQQSSTSYGNGVLNNQQQSPIQVMGIPTTTTPPPQQSSCQQPPIMINQNGSFHQSCPQKQSPIVTYPQSQQPTATYPQQNLIDPYSTMSQESFQQQSSPESPSTSTTTYDKSSSSPRGCGYQINNKKYSNSPDPLDIPNIVLTGADGELDSFQNLNLTNDLYEYSPVITTTNDMISCSNGLGMTANQQEMVITSTEISSTYHTNINSPMTDHNTPIVIKRNFIN
uniref:TORC_N domain-containing protein n=1 Tax=Strongyloides stercoralis TaxID=6248 RepID=A0A0K0ECA6_STRER